MNIRASCIAVAIALFASPAIAETLPAGQLPEPTRTIVAEEGGNGVHLAEDSSSAPSLSRSQELRNRSGGARDDPRDDDNGDDNGDDGKDDDDDNDDDADD